MSSCVLKSFRAHKVKRRLREIWDLCAMRGHLGPDPELISASGDRGGVFRVPADVAAMCASLAGATFLKARDEVAVH